MRSGIDGGGRAMVDGGAVTFRIYAPAAREVAPWIEVHHKRLPRRVSSAPRFCTSELFPVPPLSETIATTLLKPIEDQAAWERIQYELGIQTARELAQQYDR